LNGRERVVQLVSEHTHDALPSFQFFLAKRLAQVRDDEELVRHAALAETAAAHAPAAQDSAVAGKRLRKRVRRAAVAHAQAVVEAQLLRRAQQRALQREREQTLARAVDETEPAFGVEGEDGNVNLRHHRAQQRRRFQSADAVLAHRLAERVYLAHDLAQRVEAPTAARAETVVALAQRGEKVRDR